MFLVIFVHTATRPLNKSNIHFLCAWLVSIFYFSLAEFGTLALAAKKMIRVVRYFYFVWGCYRFFQLGIHVEIKASFMHVRTRTNSNVRTKFPSPPLLLLPFRVPLVPKAS